MEKTHDMTLMKARSYRAILADGYHLYNENFRKFFKGSWLLAIFYALSCGALGTLTAIKIPELTLALMKQMTALQGVFAETAKQYALSFLSILGLLLLAIVTISLASATILNKLKEHKENDKITTPPNWLTTSPNMMVRCLKSTFLTLFVIITPLVIFLGLMILVESFSPKFIIRHLTTTLGIFIVCSVLAMLFSLPLMYVQMKYLMEAPCSYWKTLVHNYSHGLNHWGVLFLVYFVSTLFVAIVGQVIMLPANILSYANQQAHQGLLIGDPLGMPSYITALTFVTFTLCSFILFYVSQVILVHNYYIYGSIETKIIEREHSLSKLSSLN